MIERVPYAGFTAQDIINRASDVDVDGPEILANGNAGFNNAYIFKVCQVLQHFVYDVGSLVMNGGANMWSEFKPGYMYVDALKNIIWHEPTGAAGDEFWLDDFLGYNHNANTPALGGFGGNFNYSQGTTLITNNGNFFPGEINWLNIRDANGNVITGINGYFVEYTINGGNPQYYWGSYDFETTHNTQDVPFSLPVTWPNNYTVTLKFGLAKINANQNEVVGYVVLPSGDYELTITATGVLSSAGISPLPIDSTRWGLTANGYDESSNELSTGLTYSWSATAGTWLSGTSTSQSRSYHPPAVGTATVTVVVTQTSSGKSYYAQVVFTDGQPY